MLLPKNPKIVAVGGRSGMLLIQMDYTNSKLMKLFYAYELYKVLKILL